MKKSKIVSLSHELIDQLTNSSDIIIDATLGNGFDSLYLSNKVSYIYAFDIQKEALLNSAERLENCTNIKAILDSHENYQKYVTNYQGVIFNLGYLPTGNKEITTTAKTTINTLDLMIKDNVARFILLVIYPGHPEGVIESASLLKYIDTIKTYQSEIFMESDDPKKAYIILLTKKDATASF